MESEPVESECAGRIVKTSDNSPRDELRKNRENSHGDQEVWVERALGWAADLSRDEGNEMRPPGMASQGQDLERRVDGDHSQRILTVGIAFLGEITRAISGLRKL